MWILVQLPKTAAVALSQQVHQIFILKESVGPDEKNVSQFLFFPPDIKVAFTKRIYVLTDHNEYVSRVTYTVTSTVSTDAHLPQCM